MCGHVFEKEFPTWRRKYWSEMESMPVYTNCPECGNGFFVLRNKLVKQRR
jgi:hypothetical protein